MIVAGFLMCLLISLQLIPALTRQAIVTVTIHFDARNKASLQSVKPVPEREPNSVHGSNSATAKQTKPFATKATPRTRIVRDRILRQLTEQRPAELRKREAQTK